MLAAKYRFHGFGALKFVFGHGRTHRFKSFSLRVVHNSRRADSRLAIVVSKKVIKTAPKRNLSRRRIYEALREHWQNIKPAYDIVVSVHDSALLDETHS